jgi:hypothetical protein
MASKKSTRKDRGEEKRRKDCFDLWTDPKNAVAARENFLRYCTSLERGYANVCMLIRDLERAARHLPAQQAVVLPLLTQDSVYTAFDDHHGLETLHLVEELNPLTSSFLKAVPEALQVARELETKLFNFAEHLAGGPGRRKLSEHGEEVPDFVLQHTNLYENFQTLQGMVLGNPAAQAREDEAMLLRKS